ncbi:MAG: M12 family metallopeptidase [Bdellovibrionales bacterium]|nr:M12 family metallopeptidase [Bdellovibrionales bacterium]
MKNTLLLTALVIILGLYFQNRSKEPKRLMPAPVSEAHILPSPTPPKKEAKLPLPEEIPHSLTMKAPPVQKQKSVKYPQVDETFAPFDAEGNRYVTQIVVVGRHLTYHGDLLVGDVKDLEKLKKQGEIKQAKPTKWPQGMIPYMVDPKIPNGMAALEAIEYLDQNTNIKFVERSNEKDYIFITDGDANCYSYLGKVGGSQHIFLAPNCGTKEILHELMHTLGFLHEQNREDRDRYVEVFWDNIPPEHAMQFKKLPNDYMGVLGRPFDYQSIMLYPSNLFSIDPNEPTMLGKNGEYFSPNQDLLSEEDVFRVNRAYPQRH